MFSVKTIVEASRQFSILKEGSVEIIGESDLHSKLKFSIEHNQPLIVKLGIDPTAPDIHLGFTVVMRKLRQFQDLGHEVVLIIGDYTATVGDPTGRSSTRKKITHEEVMTNASKYMEQFFKIVDREKTTIRYNGDWFKTLPFNVITELMSTVTVSQMLERKDFKERFESHTPISLHEFIYPIMQGYDSVMINADIEIGGTDQKFNVLMGRDLQAREGQQPQCGLFMPILLGTCGQSKMSKSYGNYIGIDESPQSIYTKLYNIPDNIIHQYISLLTDLDEKIFNNSVEAKKALAYEIVKQYHGEDAANIARDNELKIHNGSMVPEDAPRFTLGEDTNMINILVKAGLSSSKTECTKLMRNKGIKVNGHTIDNIFYTLSTGDVVRVGKRKFLVIE